MSKPKVINVKDIRKAMRQMKKESMQQRKDSPQIQDIVSEMAQGSFPPIQDITVEDITDIVSQMTQGMNPQIQDIVSQMITPGVSNTVSSSVSSDSSSSSSSSDSSSVESAEEQCIELQHDSQRVFTSIDTLENDVMQQMMASVLPKGIYDQVSQMMNLLQITESSSAYPTNTCVWFPYAPHKNIVRIIGHAQTPQNGAPELIISAEQLQIDVSAGKTCQEICEQTTADCKCITAEPIISAFDANDCDQKIIWVTPSIEGGKKFITTTNGNVGFGVFSMFTDVIQSNDPTANKISKLAIAPQQTADSDLMFIGGKSVQNILLNHLNDITPVHSDSGMFGHRNEMPSLRKVNLVMSLNSDNHRPVTHQPQIRMSVIPLTIHNPELQKEQMQECVIDQTNTEQCNVFIADYIDYDIRIENIGAELADIDIFTVEVPTNDYIATDMQEVPQLINTGGYDVIIGYGVTDDSLPQQSGRPSQIPFVIGVVGTIIAVSLMALFSILNIRKKKRNRARDADQAYAEVNDGVIDVSYTGIQCGTPLTHNQTIQAPFVTMEQTDCDYKVFQSPR